MTNDSLPHVDGSGRGMDDGECMHCGVSGSLTGAECPVRLRAALDAWQAAGVRMAEAYARTQVVATMGPEASRQALYTVSVELRDQGIDVEGVMRDLAMRCTRA